MDFSWLVPAIAEAANLRAGLAAAAPRICEQFGIERISVFVPQPGETLLALLQHGLPEQQMLRLPSSPGRSIAGYVIHHRRMVNIADVYDDAELASFRPPIVHMHAADDRTGYRTKQVLAAPLFHAAKVVGMAQLLNRRAPGPFGADDERALARLAAELAAAIAAGPALARRDPFVEGASEAMRELLEVPRLKANGDPERLLAIHRACFERCRHLDPFLREPPKGAPWTAGDVEALEWLCRLAASGHGEADRLLDRVLDQLLPMEGDLGLRVKALAHCHPRIAQWLARVEGERIDCDLTALLQWARLGGPAWARVVEEFCAAHPGPEVAEAAVVELAHRLRAAGETARAAVPA